MITMGIDIGSITAKGAVMQDGRILATVVLFTGYNTQNAALSVRNDLLARAGIDAEAVDCLVATGYGRKSVTFADRTITEISCHGAGAWYLDRSVRTVIDIGGQDSKAMVLDASGRVVDFIMNDKCAAGTGRFLEVMARALEVDLAAMGDLSQKADAPSEISSICTVFAESEVVSLISKSEKRENIIAGIHESVASRVVSLTRRLKFCPPVMMTGGVALNRGVVRALGARLGTDLLINPETAQVNGAIGAAALGRNS